MAAADGEGRRYFYHKATRHVQWEPPAAEVGDPPKPQWQSSAPPGGPHVAPRARAPETVPARPPPPTTTPATGSTPEARAAAAAEHAAAE